MTEEKRGRGRPRKETTIMPTVLKARQQEIDELIEKCSDEELEAGEIHMHYIDERLYNLATRIYVAMIEREPFLANNTDTAESAIKRAKLFLTVWEKEGEHV